MTTTARRAPSELAARVLTEALAPAVLVATLLVLVGWHAGVAVGAGRWWGLPAALFCAIIPFAYIVRGVRRGRLTDHHIAIREQRRVPLVFGVLSVLAGLVVMVVFHAPRELTALVVAGAVGLIVCAAVTHWWKLSIHTAVASGTATTLVLVYGWGWVLAGTAVALIGWARVRLRAHTPAQVLVGAAIGAAIAATVFPALR